MEKLNKYLLSAIAQEWRVLLCGPTGASQYVAAGVEVAETRINPLPQFLFGTAWRSFRMARRHRPEWVIAGSGLATPMAWLAARAIGAKLAVYLHGLDIIAPSRVYQWIWLPFIRACDIVLVNSRNTGDLAKARGVQSERLHVLHPGTEIPSLDEGAAQTFRQQHALADRPLMLSVGRLTRRKGLAEFVANALPLILAHSPEALLIVIGEEATNALLVQSGSERERILNCARAAGIEKSVLFVGACDDRYLSAAYQAAQVHVFPVLQLTGDVEGFGMVALESAAHGLTTVAFAVGGVPDAIDDPNSGVLISPGNYPGFAEAVLSALAMGRDENRVAACRDFAAAKEWGEFGRQLRALLRNAT